MCTNWILVKMTLIILYWNQIPCHKSKRAKNMTSPLTDAFEMGIVTTIRKAGDGNLYYLRQIQEFDPDFQILSKIAESITEDHEGYEDWDGIAEIIERLKEESRIKSRIKEEAKKISLNSPWTNWVDDIEINTSRPHSITMTHRNCRAYNEDRFAFGTNQAAVFDGHGGEQISQYLSKVFLPRVSAMQDQLSEREMTELCHEIDKEILEKKGGFSWAGSTASIVTWEKMDTDLTQVDQCPEEDEKNPTIYKCLATTLGDSHIFKYNPETKDAVILSIQHDVNMEGEMKRIVAAGGKMMNKQTGHFGIGDQWMNLTRAFGDSPLKVPIDADVDEKMVTSTPTFVPFTLKQGEYLLLMTDGLTERRTPESIVTDLKEMDSSYSSSKIALYLMNKAFQAKSSDNMCISVITSLECDGGQVTLTEKRSIDGNLESPTKKKKKKMSLD